MVAKRAMPASVGKPPSAPTSRRLLADFEPEMAIPGF